jgi:hypothetical protein
VSNSPSNAPTSPATSPADSIPEVRVFPKTPRCPACDSGMVAPGIRHNADCKRRRAAFDRIHQVLQLRFQSVLR